MSSEPVIRVQNLSKCYHIYDKPHDRLKQSLWRGRRRFYREFWALRDVSFEVGKGETVGIIGRNGSGKSTLLQMIAGTLTPTAGSVEVNGRVAALLELGSGFNPEFTGRENVYMNGTILGLSEEEIERRFDDIVEFADIGDFIDQPVKTYSSGMMVRLAFSVSVNVEPEILIVDEALSVGDAGFQFKCMERLERLTQSGTTLLFVSHDIGMIKAFCRRVAYLASGQIKALGSAEEIADLYMLDLHQQRKSDTPVTIKPSISEGKGIAFGTDQGRIVNAFFSETGHADASVSTGEMVHITATVAFLGKVKNPFLSMLVQDRKLIAIGGRAHRITGKPDRNGVSHAAVTFTFRASFAAGHYFLTLRLEDRQTDTIFLPVDKQVGALTLNVAGTEPRDFLGLVDLQIRSREEEGG